MIELTLAEQAQMVAALRQALAALQPDTPVELIETHISFVLLAGGQAYKFKKALRLDFLDYSSLALRRRCCAEELRLNRRTAPELYLDVVSITGSAAAPELGGAGEAIDCAVHMRAFDQAGLWDRLAARGALQREHIDQLVPLLCRFHDTVERAPAYSRFGSPLQVRGPMLDNLDALDAMLTSSQDQAQLAALREWESRAFAELLPQWAERQLRGRIRECHGDLHLGNLAQIDGNTTLFDCIEFNDDLRWTDVMSELAFLVMDLQDHRLPALAARLQNAYLERSGDYAGARVLRYYLVYRALVRAKVAALRGSQGAARPYLHIAHADSRPARPGLVITHGYAGSGKTWATESLVEALGAVRIRADVERKRLFGLDALARSGSPLNAGVYGAEATTATYARLRDQAAHVLAGGWSVVLDASFLERAQRDEARRLAHSLGLPFVILDFNAGVDVDTLRGRVRARAARGGDASEADEAVLEAQMRSAEPLGLDEQAWVLPNAVSSDWTALAQRLAG